MKYLVLFAGLFVVSLFGGSPALAQGWDTYSNARYGAIAEVPPGFSPAGPEANNSDGLIFRSGNGGLLTIYGADVPTGDFEAKVRQMITHEVSYNGWPIAGSKVTPDWAEFWGNHGSRQLRFKVLSSCNGRQIVVTRFEFNAGQQRDVERVERSLKAGPANSC